jgi:hypothetical protein
MRVSSQPSTVLLAAGAGDQTSPKVTSMLVSLLGPFKGLAMDFLVSLVLKALLLAM